MKTYKYASVRPSEYVELYSTDPQVVEWILSELKNVIPSYGFLRKTTDFSGKVFDCALQHLQSKDREVGMWIIQQLCQKGWEPFAADDYLHFRLEEDTG